VPTALPAGRRGIILIEVVGVNLFLRCGGNFLLADRDARISVRVAARVPASPKRLPLQFRALDARRALQRNVSALRRAESAVDLFRRPPMRRERCERCCVRVLPRSIPVWHTVTVAHRIPSSTYSSDEGS
jgi:hypothetical protein